MVHKYLSVRSCIYYFRWRIPRDLRLVFGASEFKYSLRTSDFQQAKLRSVRFIAAVKRIQMIRREFFEFEVSYDDYLKTVKLYWASMTSKKDSIGLITYGDLTIDFDNDDEKEIKVAKALGIDKSIQESSGLTLTSSILFCQLFEKFIAHKTDSKLNPKPISIKVEQSHTRHYEYLLGIIGNVPINKITRTEIKSAILTCRKLPKGNMKAYKNLTVQDKLELDVDDENRLSGKSVDEVRKTAQGIFAYAVENKFLLSSPAINLKLKLDTNITFAKFSDDEIREILLYAAGEGKPWKMWLPILAIYTGARSGELIQLRKQDVKYDRELNRYYFLITDKAGLVKTENSIRQIPIHESILEFGFLKYVNSVDEELFAGVKREAVTSWFTRFRDRLKISKYDDFNQRKVFHSFRHTFITASRGAGNPVDLVQQVTGHEKTSAGTTDRYSHMYTLKDVLPVVDKVNFG